MPRSTPSIPDIARAADVSTATVDRVLNNRTGVREKTRAKVERAIADLRASQRGVKAAPHATRIAVVINSSRNFSAGLAEVVRAVASEMGLDPAPAVHVHTFDDPRDLGDRLPEMAREADGIVLVGRPSHSVNEAIDDLVAAGKPVVGATTDFPESRRSCYVGMNQMAAGRLAGRLLGEMSHGSEAPVVLHIGRRSRTEDEREIGFRGLIREHFPEMRLSEIFNRSGTDEEAMDLMSQRLAAGPAPLGVLTTGAGLKGLAGALAETRQTPGRPFLLGYELLPWSERLLRNGDVQCLVAANPWRIVRRALSVVLDVASQGKPAKDSVYAPHLIFPENLNGLDWQA